MGERELRILKILEAGGPLSSGDIVLRLNAAVSASSATVKRDLASLVAAKLVCVVGAGRGTKYILSDSYRLLRPIDIDAYYEKEVDEREINESFSWELLRETLPNATLYTPEETRHLNELAELFANRAAELSQSAYKKELERLAIDLSWKSSQIEGNTYSLLETERLLRDKKTADGKTKEEAVMLLNHKDAIDFIIDNRDYLGSLRVSSIENIHSLLIKELDVDRNIRIRRVGISGTNYRPLDNEFQVKEALQASCGLINQKQDVFEKALLALVLISYIQPFMDGNKRTARIVSNAVLMGNGFCPISFRTVDSVDYKKAMLVFYEQNNIAPFKRIFIEQFEFAVNTYF